MVGYDNIATKCYPYFKLMEKEENGKVSVYFRLQQLHQSSKKSSGVSEVYLASKLSIIFARRRETPQSAQTRRRRSKTRREKNKTRQVCSFAATSCSFIARF